MHYKTLNDFISVHGAQDKTSRRSDRGPRGSIKAVVSLIIATRSHMVSGAQFILCNLVDKKYI